MQAAAKAIDAGDDAGAEPLLSRIVGENPRDAEAWHALAAIAVRNGRAAEALGLAERALALDRRNPLYLNTLGVAHAEVQQLEEAVRCFRRALKERPDYAEGHYNLGKAYRKSDNLAEAQRCYLRARRLDPANFEVANNLAALYGQQGRYDEALELLREARARAPDNAGVAIHASLALLAHSGPEASIGELASFLRTHPLAANAHAALGRRLLAEGRFAQGWREYAWRRGEAPAEFPDCAGKRVLLLPDQGLGDHLFFLRFAAALRERTAHVAFVCPAPLFELLEANPPVSELLCGGDAPGSFDLALPLGDLPRLLQTEATPAPLAISVAPARLALWRERLAALGPAPYLGVTWRGGTKRADPSEFAARGEDPLYKEIDIAALASCLGGWRGTVLILQRRPQEGESAQLCKALARAAHDLSAVNDDLVDMAALLSLIDEYVGVSNTNMHVRAGVGKTARVLIPFPPEFRWMHAGDEVPWFPGVRVYRQHSRRDWQPALERLSSDISD